MPCTTVQKITGAERLQLRAEVWVEIPDQDAERDRDQHLDIEDLVPRLMPGDGTDRFSGHGKAHVGNTESAAAIMK